jgi:hypothetical protein
VASLLRGLAEYALLERNQNHVLRTWIFTPSPQPSPSGREGNRPNGRSIRLLAGGVFTIILDSVTILKAIVNSLRRAVLVIGYKPAEHTHRLLVKC